MDDIKKRTKCWIISAKNNFHKNKLAEDGVRSECIICRKNYYDKNLN